VRNYFGQVSLKYVTGPVHSPGRFPSPPHWPVLLCDDLRISVNLAECPVSDDEVAIRDYSECEGTLAVLVAAGIVAPPHRHVQSGYVQIPICRLL
jgi:hypothetical protein